MKKILLLVLAALVLVALVACGGETTTATTTAKDPSNTQAPGTNDPGNNGEPGTNNPGNNGEPGNNGGLADIYPDAIDIAAGDVEYRGVDVFNVPGFEHHHTGPDDWYFVFALNYVDQMLNLELFTSVEESDRIYPVTDANGESYFKWTLIIDDERFEITDMYCVSRESRKYDWIRLKLPAGWTPNEDLTHGYDIKLEIYSVEDEKVKYYAWLTDPDLADLYVYTPRAEDTAEVVPDGDHSNETLLVGGTQVLPYAGPDGAAASEGYEKAFDGAITTKLCTRDMEKNLIFQIADGVLSDTIKITSISIVGANDDASAKAQCRVLDKFTIEGCYDEPTDSTVWHEVLSVDKTAEEFGEIVNYAERNYVLDEAVNYNYYRLVVSADADETGPIYQFSEIWIYVNKVAE